MKRSIVRLAAALGVLVALYTSVLLAQPATKRLQVHFIDVGQADAALIMDDEKTCKILIDSGDTRYPGSSKNFKEYLSAHLPTGATIDLVIASHPHNDHIGSMKWVLENYRVKNYVDNGQPYTSQIYKNLMKVVKQQSRRELAYHVNGKVSAKVEQVCGTDGPQVRFLHPRAGFDSDFCTANPNNCSVVVKLSFRSMSFLFPGDAEDEEEALLLDSPQIKEQLRANVLKVPHHGSDTSSSDAFLNAVKPSWIVISDGKKNVGTNRGYKCAAPLNFGQGVACF